MTSQICCGYTYITCLVAWPVGAKNIEYVLLMGKNHHHAQIVGVWYWVSDIKHPCWLFDTTEAYHIHNQLLTSNEYPTI